MYGSAKAGLSVRGISVRPLANSNSVASLTQAFPRGLACFRVKGGVGGFLHGGISLQEMVIPVIELKRKAKIPLTGKGRVKLSFDKAAVTNRFFSVTACLEPEGLFPPDEVRVRAMVFSEKSEVGFCAMAAYGYAESTREITLRNNEPNALTILLMANFDLDKVTVRLLIAALRSNWRQS